MNKINTNGVTTMTGSFASSSERDIVRDIKEKHAYVALNYEAEINSVNPIAYKLPDDQGIYQYIFSH